MTDLLGRVAYWAWLLSAAITTGWVGAAVGVLLTAAGVVGVVAHRRNGPRP